MSVYNHRPLVPSLGGRIPELLETVKNEFESLTQDVSLNRIQKDEIEHKLNQQLQEIAQFQETFYELQRSHTKIKQQYEEEIVRLRRELEIRAPQQNQNQPPTTLGGNQLFSSGLPSIGFQNYANGSNPNSNPSPNSNSNPNKRPKTEEQNRPLAPPHSLYSSPHSQIPVPNQQPPSQMMPQMQSVSLGTLAALSQAPNNGPVGAVPAPSSAPPASPAMNLPQPLSLATPIMSDPGQEKRKMSPTLQAKTTPFSLNDLDLETLPPSLKKEGSDWLVVFNKNTPPPNVDIDLAHNLEHNSVVCCVKFSFDSKYLATGCHRSAQIFDVATGAKVGEFLDSNSKEGDLYIRSVCFSPDGQYLATGAEDKQIRVWDIKKYKIKHLFTGHEQDIYSLDFSRDGQYVCSGSGDRTARIWSVETGKCLHVLGNDESGPKDAGVTSVAMSPDGRLVAAGSLDRIIRIWDAKTGRFLDKLEGHKDSVYSVSFSPDGRYLASGSLDKTIKLWELGNHNQRSTCKLTFAGHKDFVLSVAFSSDGRWIISGSKDRTVQFWDPATGQVQCMLQGHKNSVISVAISPSATYFATGSGDFKARIWKYTPQSPSQNQLQAQTQPQSQALPQVSSQSQAPLQSQASIQNVTQPSISALSSQNSNPSNLAQSPNMSHLSNSSQIPNPISSTSQSPGQQTAPSLPNFSDLTGLSAVAFAAPPISTSSSAPQTLSALPQLSSVASISHSLDSPSAIQSKPFPALVPLGDTKAEAESKSESKENLQSAGGEEASKPKEREGTASDLKE